MGLVSQFVTQTLDKPLTVLVIAPDDIPLARDIILVLKKNGLKVVHVSPTLAKLQAVNQDDIYKYILINQPKNIFSWLKPIQESLLIIDTVVTPYQGRVSSLNDWHLQTQDQARLWEVTSNELPQATYCFGQDVFNQQVMPVWAQNLTQKSNEGYLFSLGMPVFPQTQEYFATSISRVLLAPFRGDRYLFKGGEVALSNLVDRVTQQYQLLTEIKLEQKKITLDQPDEHSFSLKEESNWEVQVSNKQFSDDLAQLIASQLPQTVNQEEQAKTQVSLPKPELKQVTVKPSKPTKTAPFEVEISQTEPKPNQIPAKKQKAVEPRQEEKTDQEESVEEEKLELALQKMFADQQVERKVTRVTKVAKETKTANTKNKRKTSLFYLGLGFIGVSLGMLVLFGSFLISVSLLERQLLIVSQKLQETHTKTFSEESKQLALLTSVVEAQKDSYQAVFAESLFSYPDSLVEVSHNLIGLGESLNTTRNFVQQSVRQVFGSETGDVFTTLQAASNKANDVYQQLSLLQTAIDSLDQTKLSQDEIQKLEDFTNIVQDERKSLAVVQQLQPLMPQLLGAEGKRTYALLLQDNQELRPTGGFLNSVAMVTLDQGLVIDTQVYSIYDLEKRFSGEIEPPEEIKTLLQEDRLFFHDANWDPDFHKSAEQMAWFLEKTTGNKVSGILAFDLYAVEAMIKATGPLELPEYNEVITDRNIHERAEFHSEITLTDEPGEQSYLPVVLQKLLNQVLLTPQENMGSLLAHLNQSIKHNHLLVYLSDQNENTSFNSLGWTGTILNPQCPVQLAQDNCTVDAFYQVEANIGVNKANHYINRTTNHTISLGKTQATHTRTVSFENTSPTNAWPRGEYSAYVRFYLPKKAVFSRILIDGQEVGDSLLRLEKIDERPVVGVVVRVPIQTEQEVTLEFTTPLSQSDIFSYAFFDQRQPGVGETNQVISITSEDNTLPTTIAPQATVNGQMVTFSQSENQHQFVGISYE